MDSEKERKKRLDRWKRPINEGLIFSGTASVPSYAIEEGEEKVTVTSEIGYPIWTFPVSEGRSAQKVEDKKKRKKPEEYQHKG